MSYRTTLLLAVVLVALPVAAEIQFTEVTFTAGLGDAEYNSPSQHSLGVVWFDFDNDGLPDIFATNGYGSEGCQLYRNLGNGQFESAQSLMPHMPNLEYVGVRAADYDNDGDTDLYVYTAHEYWSLSGLDNKPDGPANILMQNQFVENGGTLSSPLFRSAAREAGVADCPSSPLGSDYPCYQTRSAIFLDYDLDGCTDLFVGHMIMNSPGHPGNRDRLYRNRCDGTFQDVTEVSGISSDPNKWRATLIAFAADLNGDLCPDIYMGHVGANTSLEEEDFNDVLMRNNCDGTFTEIYENQLDDTPAAMGVDIADLNGDGLFEMYITDARHDIITHDVGNTLYTMRAMGENRAIDVGVDSANSWGVHFMDADQDGDQDLFVGLAVHEDNPPYSILYENTGKAMVSREAAAGLNTTNVRGSAVADYDRDGDLDILLVNQPGRLQLFRNDSTEQGRSLKVTLQPTISNADAFGALVEVYHQGGVMRRQRLGGRSAHSQGYRELHFGLGAGVGAKAVEAIRVLWPSGLETVVTDVSLSEITILELP